MQSYSLQDLIFQIERQLNLSDDYVRKIHVSNFTNQIKKQLFSQNEALDDNTQPLLSDN